MILNTASKTVAASGHSLSSNATHPDVDVSAATSWLSRIAWRSVTSTSLRIMTVAAVAGGLIYWLKFSPINVDVHRVERGSVVAEVLGTGTLEARVQATIGPKISGRLREILVDQGARVETGQVLVRLDDEELQQQVAVAQAGVNAAEASIERLKADHNRAEAVVAQAQRKHARVQSLAEANVATDDSLDEAVEALAIAAAGISHADAAIVEARKQLIVAEQTLQFHRTLLADAEIVAPFAGLIVKRHRDRGDIVVPGSAVLTLVSTEELWISAWVDETEMDRLRTGLPSRVIFRSQPEQSWPGEVVRLGREADRETREFIVDVRVRDLPARWAVGQRAEVYIETDRREDVVTLPADRLLLNAGQPGVLLRSDGRAEWREVSIGIRGAELVEITQGLKAGDEIVVPLEVSGQSLMGRKITVP